MADSFIELTRVDAEPGGTPVLINLGNVAWIEPDVDGTSRIVFAVGLPYERANGVPLSIVVRESAQEIGLLAGVVRKADREAIAQAWVDQRGRRGMDDDRE
ncbi:MAG TPA: hypothetical protein VFH48_43815 [Chloroflexota bacterium]|nr:hypothetical protein [Chloroflexota bacterium]